MEKYNCDIRNSFIASCRNYLHPKFRIIVFSTKLLCFCELNRIFFPPP